MKLDVHTAVITAIVLAGIIASITFLAGVQSIRSGLHLPYFRKRRDRVVHGWRLVMVAAFLGVAGFAVSRFAEPVAYHFYPPSPTLTLTPSITVTPTITLTPTISATPTITNTPSVTNTPFVPDKVAALFDSKVTPAPDSIFSPIRFAQKVDPQNLPLNPASEFANPVDHLYGTFSFDKMQKGVQWTALWYRNNELVFFETQQWTGGTGGYGYTDWNPSSDQWLPGDYEVQIFIGSEWKQSGRFTVTGSPPSPQPTLSPTTTRTPTRTPTLSPTPTSSRTPLPTVTVTLTRTPRPTATPTDLPTATRTLVPPTVTP